MKKHAIHGTIKVNDKFSYDTSDLATWVEENSQTIDFGLIDSARSARLMNTQEGYKGTQKLLDGTVDFDLQDGSTCGNTDNGTVGFGQKTVTVDDIEILIKLCAKDLAAYSTRQALPAGANADSQSIPYEAALMKHILATNALKVDTLIWKGDKNSGNTNINKIDGIIKQADADSDVIDLSISTLSPSTHITKANAIDAFIGFDTQLPQELTSHPDFCYVTDRETFLNLTQNLYDDLKDSPQYYVEELIEGKKQLIGCRIPSTFQMVYWVPGLASTGRVFAGVFGSRGHYILATDRVSDLNQTDVWFEKKDKAMYIRMEYRLGATYRFGNMVGSFRPTGS